MEDYRHRLVVIVAGYPALMRAQALRLTASSRSLEAVTERELMQLSGTDVLAAAQALAGDGEGSPRCSLWRRRLAS
jgi:hypothetical protein